MSLTRALHFVFKVGDRGKTATFYREVLGMKVSCSTVKDSVGQLVRTDRIHIGTVLLLNNK